MNRRLIDRRDGLGIRLAAGKSASTITHQRNPSEDIKEQGSVHKSHKRMKSTDLLIKSILNDKPSEHTKEGERKVRMSKNGYQYMTSKIFDKLDKVQSSNAQFLKTIMHGRHSSMADVKPAESKHRKTASHQFTPAADQLERKRSLPRINLTSPKPKLSYNDVALYQLPNKDIFVQHTLKKRDDLLLTNFKHMVTLKTEKTAKLVSEEIEASEALKGKSILKVKLAAVHLTGQMVYLERVFTVKAIVDCYLDVYFRSDRYSFGFSSQSNKALVKRIVKLVENINSKILVLRCRDDTELIEKFMGLKEFIRYDCDNTPDVHILDAGESKLIEHMFFYFCPVFYGRQKQSAVHFEGFNAKDSMIEIPDGEDQSADQPQLAANKASHKSVVEIQKSKWMGIIEKCLTKKNILTLDHNEFDKIFEDYLNSHKKLDSPRQAAPGSSSLGHIKRFRQLLVDQIQRDRDERITRKIKIDYDENIEQDY